MATIQQSLTNSNDIVKIHGKDYITVAGRLKIAHDKEKILSIHTEVVPVTDQVVVKAVVKTEKGEFTGISAANPSKTIERQSPYEVAETSAVGRALGFAGYGALDTIATADEILKAQAQNADGDTCCCGTSNKYHALDCPARNDGNTITGKASQNRAHVR